MVGTESLKLQWQEHADVWELRLLREDETPTGVCYNGYSPEEKSYAEIVEDLRAASGKAYLATFFPSWEVMITGKEVFE